MTLPHWNAHLRGVSVSNQTVQATRAGVGSAPKGAVIIATNSFADSTDWAGVSQSIGFVDENGNTRMQSTWSRDNVGTSVAKNRSEGNTGNVIHLVNPASGLVAVSASFSQWVTDGIELTFPASSLAGLFIEIWLIFGTDTETQVYSGRAGSPSSPTTITTNFSTTYCITGAYNGNGSTSNNADMWWWPGIAAPAAIERSAGVLHNDANGTADSKRLYYTNRLNWNVRPFTTPLISAGPTAQENYTATGFDIISTGVGSSQYICGLAVHAGDGAGGEVSINVGNPDTPTTVQTQTVNFGWKPGFIYGLASATSAGATFQNSGASGYGFMDFNSPNTTTSIACQHNAGTTNTNTRTEPHFFSQWNHNQATHLYECDLINRTATGVDFDFTVVNGTARNYGYIAIEELPFSGTVTGSFGALTGAGTGILKFNQVKGDTGSFPALEGAATGLQRFVATVNGGLPALEGVGAGVFKIVGTGAGGFGALQGAATGVQKQTGAATGSFPALDAAGIGELAYTATGSGTFPSVQGAAAGALRFETIAGAGNFPALQGAAVGLQKLTGSATGSFPGLDAAASGALLFTGSSAGTFGALGAAATGNLLFTGTAQGTFPAIDAAAAGVVTVAGVFSGVGNGTFPALTGSGTGRLIHTGTSAASFPLLSGAGVGALRYVGSGAGSFPSLDAAGTGAVVFSGAAAGIFPLVTGTGAGRLIFQATATGTFPAIDAAAAGVVTTVITGVGAGNFPALEGAGVGGVAEILIDCTTVIRGSFIDLTAARGSFIDQTALQGSFIDQTGVAGSYDLVTEVGGSYDDTTQIDGSICE